MKDRVVSSYDVKKLNSYFSGQKGRKEGERDGLVNGNKC